MPYSEKVYGEHSYEVLTSSREGLQRQSDHFATEQRHDTDGYNVIPFGYCTYRNRSDDGKFTFNMNKISENGIVSKFYPVFSFENANSEFMIEYLNSSENIKKKLSVLAVGTSQVVLSFESLKKAQFPIPCKAEQDRIAALLECTNRRIVAQSKIVDSLKKYKRGVMSVLLSSKANPYYSPETWKEVSLSDVASGFEYGINAAATIYDGSHKYIRITDIDDSSHLYIQDKMASPEGQVEEKYRVEENDILFARTGASVGKSYCYRRSDGELYFAGFLIRIHVNSGVDCSYVFQNTLTEAYRRWVMLESARSGQPGINAEQYKQYRFLLPPIETQKKISFLASNLDVLISKGEGLLSQLGRIKAALLQQLFI